MSLPVNRTMWTTRERSGDFSAAGENSTHDTTYSGVQPVPWGGLPLLSVSDKAKVLGVDTGAIEQPRPAMFDSAGGLPCTVLAGAEASEVVAEDIRRPSGPCGH